MLFMLISLGVAVASTAPAGPTPIGSAAEWFGPDAYPPAAIRKSEQGRVTARISIDATGKPVRFEVTTSSGYQDLDDGTCALALQRAFFTPAHDGAGQPIAAVWPLSVRWVLPGEAVRTAVLFTGTADAPICTVARRQHLRQLTEVACRSLLANVRAVGGPFPTDATSDVPESILVPEASK